MSLLSGSWRRSKREPDLSSSASDVLPTLHAMDPSQSSDSLSDWPYDSGSSKSSGDLSSMFRTAESRVRRALEVLLDRGPDYMKTALVLSEELLKLVPVPGVAEVAHTLVSIWTEIQRVDNNREECYRLAAACADFFASLQEQVARIAEEDLGTLSRPITRIVGMFSDVQEFLLEMNNRSSLKAFAERDRTARRIEQFRADLHSLNCAFINSVQFIILAHVQGLTRACGSTPAMTPSSSGRSVRNTLAESISRSDSRLRGMGMTPSPSSEPRAPNPIAQISFAAAGWSGPALPPAVQDATQMHTSVTLSADQISRVLGRLRRPVEEGGAGYTEEQICRELAELRLFMSRAGNIQGRLLALLEEEGSQIPGALRALQLM
ncbi:hypothetical protein HDZ31DRAFT_38982 [Schizophyllum fasciatum]